VTRRVALAACAGILTAGGFMPPAVAQAPAALETFDAVWRIVRDTHFDKTLNGVNWDAARDELRPKAAESKTPAELRRLLNAMLGRLGQSHFVVIPGAVANDDAVSGGTATVGLDVRLLDNTIVVSDVHPGSAAAAQAVRTGWSVVAIAGKPVAELVASLQEAPDPRVRGLEAWRAIQARLRGPEATTVDVTFADAGGAHVTRTLARQPEPGQPVTVGNLPTMYVQVTNESRKTPAGRQAGVVGFNVWMTAVDAPFQKAIDEHRSAAGIVVDLRGNPGGLAIMMTGIAGHFIGERIPLGVMKTRDTELKFTVNPRLVSAGGQRVDAYAGPVAVLVDGMTGSASECFSGGMQSVKRVRVFGERSMGAALPSQFEKLPNGDVFIHATGDFVTADGTRLEGRGVIPDQEVPRTRADLLAGRDAALEAALRWIDAERSK
jgi:carboxyl-terminal processing protease